MYGGLTGILSLSASLLWKVRFSMYIPREHTNNRGHIRYGGLTGIQSLSESFS
jgi:hypothetical protein